MRILTSITVAGIFTLLPAIVFAHTGSDAGMHHLNGMMQGSVHPFTGLDHLAAMTTVGIWSAMTARRVWVAPLAFAVLLLTGALLGVGGIQPVVIEPMVAVSLLVIGLLLATRTSLPTIAAGTLVGAFALFHGMAHGTELSHAQSIGGALTGMIAGTILLHVIGLVIGMVLKRVSALWPRLIGLFVSILGIGLLSTSL